MVNFAVVHLCENCDGIVAIFPAAINQVPPGSVWVLAGEVRTTEECPFAFAEYLCLCVLFSTSTTDRRLALRFWRGLAMRQTTESETRASLSNETGRW